MKKCNTKVKQVIESKIIQLYPNVENLWITQQLCGEVNIKLF